MPSLLLRLPLSLLLCFGALVQEPSQEKDKIVERLLDQIAAQERSVVAGLKRYSPIVETYIQDTPLGADFLSTGDHYFLGKLELDNGFEVNPLVGRAGKGRKSGEPKQKRGSLVFFPKGFAQMIFPDSSGFDRAHYQFNYVRREFLGEVRCLVFDVSPNDRAVPGRFLGRIWVEDVQNHIVRFNGTYTESRPTALYFHFDSWRTNAVTGEWLPTYIYVEESGGAGKRMQIGFKGQTRLWGYKPVGANKLDELTSILVEGNSGVKDESASKDISPIESQRAWERHAEENVLERLERTGLIAPKGDVDKVLNTVVNNLLATNNLNLDVECRVLMTTPMETFSLPHTIVLSRGLIDVLPDEGSLAMVLANELAQIALGYTTQTRYAFQDQLMFSDEETLQRFRFQRGSNEMDQAGKKAIEMLSVSPYKDKLGGAVLFLRALNARAPRLPNLIQANLGNQLATTANLERMAAIAKNAPALNEESLSQIAALPLGSRVKVDPFANRISLVKSKPVALLSAREKMAFEVSPFLPYLVRTESTTPENEVGAGASPTRSKALTQ